MINIRTATINDINSITEIYNEAVLNTTATFDTETKSVENRIEWFNNHGKQQPIIVAEENNKIVGWVQSAIRNKFCLVLCTRNPREIRLGCTRIFI